MTSEQTWSHLAYVIEPGTKVITTLGLWQIVGLIALTLLVVGILRRLATLIAMVLLQLWSKRQRNAMSANEKTRPWQGWSVASSVPDAPLDSDHESHSLAAIFAAQEPYDNYVGEDDFAGSTGVQPGGVSWLPPVEKRSWPSNVVKRRK